MSRKEALSSFIQQIHGRPVVVKLNSGVDYRGEFVYKFTNLVLTIPTDKLISCMLTISNVCPGLAAV